MQRSIRYSTLVFALAAAAGGVARADNIYKLGAKHELPLLPSNSDVTILRLDDDKLSYRTRAGADATVALAEIFYLDMPGDSAFTAADLAYATHDYEKAVDGFVKALRGADALWKRRYVASRLLDAANQTKRFDASVEALIAAKRADVKIPDTLRPKLPAKGSKYLDDAATALSSAIQAAPKDASRRGLLAFLVEVDFARDDQAALATTINELGDLGDVDPKVVRLIAETRLTQARAAMQAKRYDVVISTIDSAAPLIVEPGQQAEALSLVADARAALADATGDPAARRDAAIAYLRIVAHLSGEPSAAGFVTRSFLAAARLDAAVGDVAAARLLYDQLRSEYPDSPAAVQAAALAAKLPADVNATDAPNAIDSPTPNAR